MKKLIISIIISLFLIPFLSLANTNLAKKLSGKILLQIELNGEAWYVNPNNLQRYYLGRPQDAFDVMRELGLGVSNQDFNNFKISAPQKLAGKILLKVEDLGKAYYVNPVDLSLHYLGTPQKAFDVMRTLGLGITNNNLAKIVKYDPERKEVIVKQDVPFTSQAPDAQWDMAIFQDGCEEASAIMAMSWVKDETLNLQISKEKIIAISNYQAKNLGGDRDISTYDTSELIQNYFGYNNIVYKQNVSLNDLINEISNGNIIIAPIDGQKIGNIYFTPPGPINHMLVIIGYNSLTQEFITNDPGTKWGKGYRYNEDVLFNALRDYPTGYHKENLEVNKNIIVIKPKSFN